MSWQFWPLKGIVQPFELGSESRLIRSAVINWRTGKLFQCCESGSGSVRIRNFWPDPDPIRSRNEHFGSGFESGSEINQKKEPYIQAKITWFQRCGTVTIFYGSGSGSSSDFWKVMVPVPTFEKLCAGWWHTITYRCHRQLSVESAARDSPAKCRLFL